MSIPSRQIGWGTEENLLWQISKQLEQLTGVTSKISSGGDSPYLVYSALLDADKNITNTITPTVLQNTLGVDITWEFAGSYGLNAVASESIFLLNKTLCFATASAYNGELVEGFGNYDEDESYVTLIAIQPSGTPEQNFTRMNIEIRVYP